MENPVQFTFADIVELQDELKKTAPSFARLTLPEFSTKMQEISGHDFSAGMEDSKLKRFSAGLDRFIGKTRLPEVTGAIGRGATSLFTDDPKYLQMGQEMGEGLPRGFVDLLPAAAVAATAEVSVPVAAIGYGLSALLGGSGAYEKTGSKAAGVIGGAAAAAFPGATKLGQQAAVSVMKPLTYSPETVQVGAKALTSWTARPWATGAGEKAAELAGETIGQTVLQEAQLQATDWALGKTTPLDEHLFALTGSAVPGVVLGARHVLKGPQVGSARSLTEAQTLQQAAKNQQAKVMYDIADAERRAVATNKRIDWQTVTEVQDGKPVDTGFVEFGGLKVPVAWKDNYHSLLSELSASPTKLSVKDFAKRHGIDEGAAGEIFSLAQQRGVVGMPDATGNVVQTADVNPKDSAITGGAVAASPDVVEKVTKKAAKKAEQQPVDPAPGHPELPGTQVSIEQTAVDLVKQTAFKDDPQIREALAKFEASMKPAASNGSILTDIVRKMANGEALTPEELAAWNGAPVGQRLAVEKGPVDLGSQGYGEASKTEKPQQKLLKDNEEAFAVQAKQQLGDQVAEQAFGGKVVDLTPEEMLGRAQLIAAKLRVLVDTAFKIPIDDLNLKIQVQKVLDETKIAEYAHGLMTSGMYVDINEVASRSYNMVMRNVAKRIEQALNAAEVNEGKASGYFMLGGKMVPRAAYGKQTSITNRPSVTKAQERLGELPPTALKEAVLASRMAESIPEDMIPYAYVHFMKEWDAMGKPGEDVLGSDKNGVPLNPEKLQELKNRFKFSKKRYEALAEADRLQSGAKLTSLQELEATHLEVPSERVAPEDAPPATGLEVIREADFSPDDFAMRDALEQEMQGRPDRLSLEGWDEISREMGGQRGIRSNLIQPLNAMLSFIKDGYYLPEAFRGQLRFRFVEDMGVHPEDLAVISGKTPKEFRDFVGKYGLPYLEAYFKKYLPETTAVAMKRMEQAEARTKARLAESAPKPSDIGVEESRVRVSESDAKRQLAEAGVDPDILRAPGGIWNPQIGAQRFFNEHFLNRGFSGAEAARLSEVAVRMVSFVQGIDFLRIGKMDAPENVFGASFPSQGRWNGFIALAQRKNFFQNPGTLTYLLLNTTGHELFHALHRAAEQKVDPTVVAKIDKMKALLADMGPDGRAQLIQKMYEVVLPDSVKQDPEVLNFIGERTRVAAEGYLDSINPDSALEETLADFTGIMLSGLASKEPSKVQYFKDLFRFGSTSEQDFMRMMYVRVADVAGGLEHYFDRMGLTESKTKSLGTAFGDIHDIMSSMMRDVKEVDAITEQFRKMQTNEPEAWLTVLREGKLPIIDYEKTVDVFNRSIITVDASMTQTAKTLLGVGDKKLIQEKFGISPYAFERWLYPAAQLAEQYPILKPVFRIAFNYRGMANDTAEKILMPFLGTGKGGRRFVDPNLGGLKKVLSEEDTNKAVTAIALAKNSEQRVFTDSEMRGFPAVRTLSPDKQDAVVAFHRAVEQAMPRMVDVILKGEADKVVNLTTRMLQMKKPELTAEKATQLGRDIAYGVYVAMGRQPDAGVKDLFGALPPVDQARMTAIAQEIGNPSAFFAAQQTALSRWGGYTKLHDSLFTRKQDGTFAYNDWFMSEVRLGQYYVSWKTSTGKHVGSRGFDDKLAAARFADEMDKKGFETVQLDKYDARNRLSGMDQRLVNAYSELDREAFANAKRQLGANTSDVKAFEEFYNNLENLYTPGEAAQRATQGKGYSKYFLGRQLKEGREYINMAEGFFTQVETLTNGYARAFSRERGQIALADPTMQANPSLQSLAAQHLQTVLNPPAKEWTTFKNFIFNYYLGFNLSSMLIERSQSLVTVVPQLVRDGAGVGESYRYLWKGATEKTDKNGKFLNTEVNNAVEKAYRNQVLDFGVLSDFHNKEDVSIHNIRALAQGGRFAETKSFVTKPFAWLSQTSRSIYAMNTTWNARLTFVAGFKFAREKLGRDVNGAYDYAEGLVRSTNYSGGAAARPVGLFADLGKTHGAVGAMYSLQSYTFSAISQMSRYMRDSISRNVAPDQQAAARKAAGQMIATQLVFAGALGLPAAGGLLAVVEEFFPGTTGKLRESLATAFTDDQEHGSVFADVALHGVMNRVTGVDIANRVGLGNFMGVNNYDGFSLKNLLGPGYGLGEAGVNAAKAAVQGDFGTTAEALVPNAIRGIVKMQNDDWDFRDKQGRLLFEGTTPEKILYATGLKTARLARLREEQRLVKTSEDVAAKEMGQFHRELAEKMRAGDVVGVRESLVQRQKDNPDYSAPMGARRVVELLQEMQYPIDPLRSGAKSNVGERGRIGQTFGAPDSRPSEVKRLMERKGLERALGVPGTGAPTRTEMTRATMIDRLVQMNPTLSYQAAAMMVDRMRTGGVAPQLMGGR